MQIDSRTSEINTSSSLQTICNASSLYFLYSFIWGGSSGLLMCETMRAETSWSIRIIPVALLIDRLVDSNFRLRNDQEKNLFQKVFQLFNHEKGMVFGFSHAILFTLYSESESILTDNTKTTLKISLLALNVFSVFASLYCNKTSLHAGIIKTNDYLFKFGSSVFNLFAKKQNDLQGGNDLENRLRTDIEELEKNNKLAEDQIQEFKTFIAAHPLLLQAFEAALQQNVENLLPPPTRDQSPSVQNPIAEKWRQVTQRAAFLESVKTRIKDFLIKNPKFVATFRETLQEQNPVHFLANLKLE